jgi:catalase
MHRQAIHRGRVSYEPNSLGGGCPFQAGAAGFVSFPEPVKQDELRGHPEKFAEHYNQATLFFNSQTPEEQAHIAGAFRFELSKVTVPAVRSAHAGRTGERVARVGRARSPKALAWTCPMPCRAPSNGCRRPK